MPSTSSIEAGRAFLKLFVDDNEFRRGLTTSLNRVQAFGRSLQSVGVAIGAAGAAMTAPFLASLKVFTQVGSELHDLSQRTGISVESLSELKFAAEQSGTSLDAIARAARQMQKNGLDPRTFDEVAARIARIEDPVQRAQAAFEAFGRSAGSELLPLLGDLDMLRQKARDAGVTMSTEAAASAEAFGDAMDALKASVRGVAVAIGETLAPKLTELSEKITEHTGKLGKWVRENQSVVESLFSVAAAVGAVGAALTAVGVIVEKVTTAVKALLPFAGFIKQIGGFALAAGIGSEIGAGQFRELVNTTPVGRLPGAPGSGGPFAGFFGPLTDPFKFQELVQNALQKLPAAPGANAGIDLANTLHRLAVEQGELAAGGRAARLSLPGGGGPFAGVFGPLIDPLKALDAIKGLTGLSTAISGPTGTFSGKLAGQIFGDDRLQRQLALEQRQLSFAIKTEAHLAKIARRRAVLVGGR